MFLSVDALCEQQDDLVQEGVVYAIRSVSSGKYLDGRGGHQNPLITARNPRGDKYLNWRFKRTNLGWAIHSVSSSFYLDGRGGEAEPLMTNRDPTNDKFLNWRFERTNGGNIAIRSISSNRCLDGRNQDYSNPLMTARDPFNDQYLQWRFERMEQ